MSSVKFVVYTYQDCIKIVSAIIDFKIYSTNLSMRKKCLNSILHLPLKRPNHEDGTVYHTESKAYVYRNYRSSGLTPKVDIIGIDVNFNYCGLGLT